MKNAVFFILLIVHGTSPIFGQLLAVHGIITSASKRPVAFAHIYSEALRAGTFSNEEGEFRFVADSLQYPLKLSISHIGFQTTRLECSGAMELDVMLRPSTVMLQEVNVVGYSARQIMQRAIDVLDSSIVNNAIYITSFIREKLTRTDSLIYRAEVLTKSYNVPYFDFMTDNQVTVLKGRYDSPLPDSLINTFPKVINGVQSSIGLDILRKRPVFLKKKGMKKYRYAFDENHVLSNGGYYCIEFMSDEGKYSGLVFIEEESFMISKIEMLLTEVGLRTFVYRDMKVISFDLTNEYINVKEKGILMKAAVLKSQVYSKGSEYTLELNCVSSEFQFDKVKPFRQEEISSGRTIKREVFGKEDDDFWIDDNVILIDNR